MKLKGYMILINYFLFINVAGQEVKSPNTARININKQIKLIAKGVEYNTYKIKDYLNRNDADIEAHPKYYIDIPKDLSFRYYRYRGRVGTYIFSDSLRYFAVEIHYKKYFGREKLISGLYNYSISELINELPKHEKENIKEGFYFGIFSSENYLIYYYNVNKMNVEIFNKAIRSLRKKR